MKIRKKTIVLDALVATADGTIETLEGTHAYSAGDVIVTGTRGERWPVKREIFFETYDIVSSEGHVPYPDGVFGDGWICGNCGAASASDAVARGLDPCPGKRS